ncbi:2-oxo acid dehydrogenase subunit E2 [Streptomyces marokkonensis]|uniref:Dihydrolipoamide acetyltransferase component of pyruvate dehydrogenase complex n=1 Tax=Streptomyces marokkonensis TaxID=324855 RepID=A0ABP7NRD1_9ACTN
MRREFPLPDLGEGLTGAEIVRWLVRQGDRVGVDQPLVEVETAKTRVEIPSPYAGEVLECRGAAGEELPVGSPLVVIAEDDGSAGGHRPRRSAPGAPGPAGTSSAAPAWADPPGREPVLVGYGSLGAAPAAPPHRAAGPVAAAAAAGTRHGPVPVVSPLVRRLARDHGIDLRTVSGTGPAGLVGRSDVVRAVEALTGSGEGREPDRTAPVASAPHAPPTGATLQGPPVGQVADPAADPAAGRGTGMTTGRGTRPAAGQAASAGDVRPEDDVLVWHGARRTAVRKLTASHREIPAATCWLEADATGLLELCRDADAADAPPGPRIGVLTLIARMCVAALARHPALGSRVVHDADGTAVGVRPPRSIGLGIATRTDRGVVVPVVHGADRLTTARLGEEIARLTAGARDGTLAPHELTGGCFTVNNHGVLGTDGAVPLINHPETAMLGVGRIARRPWVVGDAVLPRSTAPLSLTFDHRVCDGATAADFLGLVARAVNRPATLALHL